MVRGTFIPPTSPKFRHQSKLADCPDEFLSNVVTPPQFVPIHRVWQFVMFLLFFGVVKFFAALIAFVLWMAVLAILPLSQSFFSSLEFKRVSHSVARHLVRLFLFSLGVVRININGGPGENTRIYASNCLSALDALVHFYATPITIVSSSEIPGWERLLIGSIFDIVAFDYTRQRRRSRKPHHQLGEAASDPRYFPLRLFPEGSPTTGDALTKFHPEYFVTDYAVQPVALQYFLALTPRGFNSLHTGDGSVVDFFWRIFSVPWITATVSYLVVETPKTPTDGGQASAALCQLAIANRLGVRAVAKGANRPLA
jgi:hypothetical protein